MAIPAQQNKQIAVSMIADVVAGLVRAGGKWTATKNKKRQFDLNTIDCDHGWVIYAHGDQAKVRKALGSKYKVEFSSGPGLSKNP